MIVKEIIGQLLERGNAMQTFWGFYITISLGLIAFFGSARRSKYVAGLFTIVFIAFATVNCKGMTEVAKQRKVFYELLAEASKKPSNQDAAIAGKFMESTKRPDPVSVRNFHIGADVGVLIAIWVLALWPEIQTLSSFFPGAAMQPPKDIKILFIAGFGPVVPDVTTSRTLYESVLGIQFKQESGTYLHTESLPGVKTFALWPLSQAAQSCFGTDSWPVDTPSPQAWLEFDVENVEQATLTLERQGHRLLVKNKKEPWGQIVSRFLSPEGLLVGITFTPVFRGTQ